MEQSLIFVKEKEAPDGFFDLPGVDLVQEKEESRHTEHRK